VEYLAHIRKHEDGSRADTQTLEAHLKGAAELAKRFAEDFDSADWAYALGKLHDLGKGTPEWQNYLINGGKKIPHSIYGAKFAEDSWGVLGRLFSYSIAGHHAGLPNYYTSLKYRLDNAINKDFRSDVQIPKEPPWIFDSGLDCSFWIRMLFSCLIDADRLDTERFCNPKHYKKRKFYLSKNLSIDDLYNKLNEYINNKIKNTPKDKRNSIVFKSRQIVLENCKTAAKHETGFFSLTVPTGGGKTLSSMAFALNHAKIHGKKRIIYVIPYTSIIEQNASIFKDALGRNQVIEHHSSIDINDSDENDPNMDDLKERVKLAIENWEAPIIVTTTVQFYESLFSAKTSTCRKLHNIANSVVILDEAQLIPTEFLTPILQTLKLLTTCYNTSIIFCTATQPAFKDAKNDEIKKININPTEIIENVDALYNDLQRVVVQMPPRDVKMEWQDLANELKKHEQVLCIVSTRKSARELYSLMPKGTYHLSAQMCAEHRSKKIKDIKEILENGKPIRVISTQLIEAGVDIDFPIVFKQMAGLDSIAQAAGRCNREGKLQQGNVIVFNSHQKPPKGLLLKAAETTQNLPQYVLEEPLKPQTFKFFFETFYGKVNSLDGKNIYDLLKLNHNLEFQFMEASEKFKIIPDEMQKSIIIPYSDGEKSDGKKYIDRLKNSKVPDFILLRKLQRYTVSVYENQFQELLNRGSLEEVLPNVFILKCDVEYNDDIGLLIDEMPNNPIDYIINQ
jgi:CRISPR-associated endonuclease/helicase Cas3